jgi:SAM-dependent methyltransferase
MNKINSYKEFASIYDSVFMALGKDYQTEAEKINDLIFEFKRSANNNLLDLGCGTGEHIKYLRNRYEIIGMDNSKEMLAVAQIKNPNVSFFEANMLDFNIQIEFDVIICLFSAIGYLLSRRKLEKVINNVNFHLKSGGVFLVEPWYSPDEIHQYLDLVEFGEKNGIKACRMRETEIEGNVAKTKGHVLVSQNGQVRHLITKHKFGLFSKKDFSDILTKNGFRCSLDHDLCGRGLYVGVKEN